MEIKNVTILYAGEGMMLTNGNAYGKTVALGAGDSPENWHEITMEEYQNIFETEDVL